MRWLANIRRAVGRWASAAEPAAGAYMQPAGPGAGHAADPESILGNPLRGLTPTQAASLMECGLRGELTRIQWLMYWVEQIDADLFALVERRAGGVGQLDWKVAVDEKADERGFGKLAVEQQAALTEAYNGIDNLSEAVEFLGLAVFRGYAHLSQSPSQSPFGSGAKVTHLEPLDQWWWLRDGMYGDWYWNGGARYTSARGLGEAARIDAAAGSGYIVREVRRPLLWIALLKHLRANANQKWWDKFCEICSKQGVYIIAPEGLSADQAADYREHAAAVAAGGSGVLSAGSQVAFSNALRGAVPFEGSLRYLSEKLVLAGTGGMLTMLNQPTGIGGGQSEEHGKAFDLLLRRDARAISEVMQRQFDRRVLEAAFPGQPVVAYWRLDAEARPDPGTILDHAVKAAQAGLKVDADEMSERTGYTLDVQPPAPAPQWEQVPWGEHGRTRTGTDGDEDEEEEERAGAARKGLKNRGVKRRALRNRSGLSVRVADALGVPEEWMDPAAELLAEIERKAADTALSDADLAAYLERAAAALPELFDRMDVEALAGVLEGAMGTAALEGARVGMRGAIPRT